MRLGRTGFGDIVPAMYPIPANPVMQGYYAQQQALAASQKKSSSSGMGLFVPASFNEPDNPVKSGMTNYQSNAIAPGGTWDGPKKLTGTQSNAILKAHATLKAAGPTSSGVVGGVAGLGDFDTSSLTNFMNSLTTSTCTSPTVNCISTGGINNMVILGGGLVALFLLSRSGSSGSSRKR
jgi:hypothetical protein